MLEVRPYEGVGPLDFGMSPHQTAQHLGAPDAVTTNRANETVHRYRAMTLTFDDRGLVEVGILPEANPRLRSMDPMTPKGLSGLIAADGDAQETVGFVVLLNLGIAVTGVHNGDQGQLAVNAFRSGRWNKVRKGMRSFSALTAKDR